jgi:hypothetical protein
MSGLVTHTIGVANVKAATGQIASIEIDKIAPGPARVGQLSLTDTALKINSGTAYLQNVRFLLQLEFTLGYWYNFGFGISGSGSENLGSIAFALNAGNVLVPTLNNIALSIPSVTASDVTASIAPIVNLALGGGGFTGLAADTVAVPSGGFQLGGLGLGAVSIASVQVPNALVGSVSIQQFSPSGNIVVPSVGLTQIQLPSASAPDIQSADPVAVNNIQASAQGVAANFGVFGVSIMVTPIINTYIGALTLSGVTISGSVAQANLQNVSVPIVITGINLKTIAIGGIDINNITL